MKTIYSIVAASLFATSLHAQEAIQNFNNKLANAYEQKTPDASGRQVAIVMLESLTAAGSFVIANNQAKEAKVVASSLRKLKNTRTREELQKELSALQRRQSSFEFSAHTVEGIKVITANQLTPKALAEIKALEQSITSISNLPDIEESARAQMINDIRTKIEAVSKNPKNLVHSQRVVGNAHMTGKKYSAVAVQAMADLQKQIATAPLAADKAQEIRTLQAHLKRIEGNIAKRLGKASVRIVMKTIGTFILVDVGARGYVLYVIEKDPGVLPLLTASTIACSEVNCAETVDQVLSAAESLLK